MARLVETSALHGRSDELAALEASLGRSAAGTLQYALVEGEAGIGKSEFLAAALGRARERRFWTFLGRADEVERGRPFGPLAEALRCVPETDDPRRAEIARLLTAEPVDAAGQAGTQFRIVDAFVELVEELALSHPIAIGLDDLQWADSATLLTLRSLGRRLPHAAAVLVVSVRPLPRGPELEQLLAVLLRDGARHIVLGPLDDDAVAALVADLVSAEPTTALLEQVRGAGGNPLFVTELIQALLQEGAIDVVDGRAELAEPVLPPSLRLTILRRLGFLEPEALELLRVASVLGSTFSSHDVATVMDRAPAALVGAAASALRAGVLVEREARLAFRHDLIREAIYEDLPQDMRAALHRDAGQRLAAAGAPAARVAEQLALGAREEDAEAAGWLRRAARETAPRDPAGAVGLLRRALELLPEAAQDDRNDVRAELATLLAYSGAPAEAEAVTREVLARPRGSALEGRLRVTLVQALLAQGRWGDVVAEVDQARDHARIHDRDRGRLMAEGALARIWLEDLDAAETDAEEALRLGRLTDDPVAVCFALGHLSSIADQRGRFGEGLELAREGVEVALRAGAVEAERRHPHIALGGALIAADRLREAHDALEEGRRLGERAGTAWDLPLYHSMLALARYYLGEWDDALTEIEAGLALADELGSGVALVTALSLRADIAVHRNELQAAEDAIREAGTIVERLGPQWGMVWYTGARAHLLEASGDAEQALAMRRDAWEAISDSWVESALRTGPALARAAAAAGAIAVVRDVAATMAKLAAQAGVAYARGGALLSRALAEHDADAALAAVEAYRPGERLPEIAAACEDAGRLLAGAGREREARGFFEEALAGYEGLAANRDIARTLAAMRHLGLRRKRRGARKRPDTGWESLTPSELDVVRLAAEGLTNPEIGRRLFLSPRTVQTHLKHVFQKLDISSRVELAAEATRRGAA